MAVTRGGVSTAKATAPRQVGNRPAVPTKIAPATAKGSTKPTTMRGPK